MEGLMMAVGHKHLFSPSSLWLLLLTEYKLKEKKARGGPNSFLFPFQTFSMTYAFLR